MKTREELFYEIKNISSKVSILGGFVQNEGCATKEAYKTAEALANKLTSEIQNWLSELKEYVLEQDKKENGEGYCKY